MEWLTRCRSCTEMQHCWPGVKRSGPWAPILQFWTCLMQVSAWCCSVLALETLPKCLTTLV